MNTAPVPSTAAHDIDVWGTSAYEAKIARIRDLLTAAKRVFTIAHPYADGDALGSQLGLYHWCRAAGKECVVLNFDPIPPQISWLEGTAALTDCLPDGEFDLAILMETTEASRMGDRTAFFARARTCVHLDHHLDVPGLGHLNLLDPRASSTCEILYNILEGMNPPFPPEALEALYVGIMTDTGNFRFPSTTPRVHEIAARMIAGGLKVSPIFKRVYETNDWRRVVLHGITMERATRHFGGLLITSWLTLDDFARLGATEIDADGSVTPLTTIAGAEVIVMFREIDAQSVKVSFRSTGRVDVQSISKTFGGGGHRLAAGANFERTGLQTAMTQVITSVGAALNALTDA
ncbi:MAG TPA: bifunctional oligoribonuclease/PAP phosphatase NrnA [Candidatus Ozemobacteraceae bacterium]|nr:bifunctional oligoribonuclease/PAP phosphatase NrnA [Candidatus Ozemobacteraceae bacterium]